MWSEIKNYIDDKSEVLSHIRKSAVKAFYGIDGNIYFYTIEDSQKVFYKAIEETLYIGMEYVDIIKKIKCFSITRKDFFQMWKKSKGKTKQFLLN